MLKLQNMTTGYTGGHWSLQVKSACICTLKIENLPPGSHELQGDKRKDVILAAIERTQ
jgi:hypothetical protein